MPVIFAVNIVYRQATASPESDERHGGNHRPRTELAGKIIQALKRSFLVLRQFRGCPVEFDEVTYTRVTRCISFCDSVKYGWQECCNRPFTPVTRKFVKAKK